MCVCVCVCVCVCMYVCVCACARVSVSGRAGSGEVSRKARIAMVNKSWQDMMGHDAGAESTPGDLCAENLAPPCAAGARSKDVAGTVGCADGEKIATGAAGGRAYARRAPRGLQSKNAGRRRVCLEEDRPLSLEQQLELYYSHVAPELAAKACQRGERETRDLSTGRQTGRQGERKGEREKHGA